jgi:hypothetical protein
MHSRALRAARDTIAGNRGEAHRPLARPSLDARERERMRAEAFFATPL